MIEDKFIDWIERLKELQTGYDRNLEENSAVVIYWEDLDRFIAIAEGFNKGVCVTALPWLTCKLHMDERLIIHEPRCPLSDEWEKP